MMTVDLKILVYLRLGRMKSLPDGTVFRPWAA